jgi:DNA-binding LacI/PurR family transcriptional regulator
MSVPGDVSVTGFDNISLSEFAHPALTTADVPRETIGRLIFDALVAPAGADRALARADVVVETELIVRESTARPRARAARPRRER